MCGFRRSISSSVQRIRICFIVLLVICAKIINYGYNEEECGVIALVLVNNDNVALILLITNNLALGFSACKHYYIIYF